MDNVTAVLEKVASNKKRKAKKKPAGGRKPKDVYAPDMSGGAPGTKSKSGLKPKKDLSSKAESFKADNPKPAKSTPKPKKEFKGKAAKSFKGTLHDKVDALSKQVATANKPKAKSAVKAVKFTPKKLGLVAAGAAGVGALAAKVRANRKAKENA